MPLYPWKCLDCEATDNIVSDVDNRDTPPQLEGKEAVCKTGEPHKWKRIIEAPRTAKGPSWGPGKGHW